jgi:hypothetical protein
VIGGKTKFKHENPSNNIQKNTKIDYSKSSTRLALTQKALITSSQKTKVDLRKPFTNIGENQNIEK